VKIDEFARKYELTRDTIHYYIKIGLLLPPREGNVYRFDEISCKKMDKILFYKSLGFSLYEIRGLISLESYFCGKDSMPVNMAVNLFSEKAQEIRQRIENDCKDLEQLEKQIFDLEGEENPDAPVKLDHRILEILACPHCDKAFSLNAESIEIGYLSGDFNCACGFSINIESNMISTETEIDWYGVAHEPEDYLKKAFNPDFGSHINKINKAINSNYQSNSSTSYNILSFQNINDFYHDSKRTGGYDIIVNLNMNYLKMLQSKLSASKESENCLLFYCKMDKLPLKKESIGLIIDLFMTDVFIFSEENRFLEIMANLLSKDGTILHFGFSADRDSHLFRRNQKFANQYSGPQVLQEFQRAGFKQVNSRELMKIKLSDGMSDILYDKALSMGYRLNKLDRLKVSFRSFKK